MRRPPPWLIPASPARPFSPVIRPRRKPAADKHPLVLPLLDVAGTSERPWTILGKDDECGSPDEYSIAESTAEDMTLPISFLAHM